MTLPAVPVGVLADRDSTITALEVSFTTRVASFRNPLYATAQVCLPCPPPSTVGGLLGAAAGGWDDVDPAMRFAMAFTAAGEGTDLETFHPLDARGRATQPIPRDREFLSDIRLTLWLLDDIELWLSRLRRPVWPLRLGRSQDLVGIDMATVELRAVPGRQRAAVVPATTSTFGSLLQLPTAISRDRSRTRWGRYRFRPARRDTATLAGPLLSDGLSTADGQGVVLLPPTHPDHAEAPEIT
ncbi:CRISPR-associated protein Cas5 [Candidatus Protofrankia californiensis]|uniref:CRISPR-associated protein Cas5 n=1 Tax=Candidatus Protofrankia californiensis TaxID=1839754 RepID=UPI00104155CC|nr:CRISPR-associated protein Cas5 [Candidatus Protofrankia californiensis]